MPGPVRSQSETANRVVRVFVSSTFRDMHAERDELVLRVFPQLRKLCEERGVTWTEVDLRWGITDEQSGRGRSAADLPGGDRPLPAVLHRPAGRALRLGAGRDSARLIDEQPWLAEHREKSVTELEIIHGVLNNPAMANRACFYFRDPGYVDTVPAEERPDFVEDKPRCSDESWRD